MASSSPPGGEQGRNFTTNSRSGSVLQVPIVRNDSLHILFFMKDPSNEEKRFIQSIISLAKAPPKRMSVILNGKETSSNSPRLARAIDLQAAISDPMMLGTIVISHGSPQGKIWESHGTAICPDGFKGDAKYPCAMSLRPRMGRRPQWILLGGCHVGAAEDAWKRTFGFPWMLDASEVYTTGGKSDLRGTSNDTESTIP